MGASATFADGRFVQFSYDANGNLTSITPPGKSAHDFGYNAVDLPLSYTPPTVSGTGGTGYGYNLDRNLTAVTRPDGGTITYGYDTAGRPATIGTPTGTTTLINSEVRFARMTAVFTRLLDYLGDDADSETKARVLSAAINRYIIRRMRPMNPCGWKISESE